METIVRYSARQGNFSATQKLIDLEIPANSGVVDLSQTYISVNMSVNVDDTSTATTEAGVWPQAVGFNARDGSGADAPYKAFISSPTTSILVKNASLSSSVKGKISDIRNVACLRVAQALYQKDEAQLNNSKNALQPQQSNHVIPVGAFAELNQGLEKSKQTGNEIQIALKDIFNFCKEETYDTGKMGALRIHAELHLDKLGVSTTMSVADFAKKPQLDAAASEYSLMINIAGVANAQNLQTAHTYDTLEDCPFYNQMKCTLSHSTAAGPQADIVRQITSVLHDPTTKRVNLTIDTPIQAGALTTTALNLVPVIPNGQTINFDKIDLVANYTPESGADSIQYTEYQTMEDNFPVAKSFQRNYHLAPNCVNVWVLFPSPIISGQDQTLGNDNISSYRIAIDNKELTNRRIEYGGPIHNDLIAKTHTNQGIPLKNLLNKIRVRNFNISDDQNSKHQISAIACPIPNAGDGKQKMLTLDITAKDTVPASATGDFQLSGNIAIYQEVVKQI